MHSLFLLILLLMSLPSLLVQTTNGDEHIYIADCPGDTIHTPSSAFQANLDALLSSLPASAAASSGFATNVTGAAPDERAYGLAQCRGDLNASECRACLDASVREAATKCPGQKNATIIYDACQLRYSDASFFGVYERSSLTVYMCSRRNATQMEYLSTLMVNLTATAAYRSPRMFVAGAVQVTTTTAVTLYGMVQCTRDLAADDCNSCLSAVSPFRPYYCDGKESFRMFGRSCYARVELYRFYEAQAVEAAMLPAPAPAGGGTTAPDVNAARTHANHSNAITCMLSLLYISHTFSNVLDLNMYYA